MNEKRRSKVYGRARITFTQLSLEESTKMTMTHAKHSSASISFESDLGSSTSLNGVSTFKNLLFIGNL